MDQKDLSSSVASAERQSDPEIRRMSRVLRGSGFRLLFVEVSSEVDRLALFGTVDKEIASLGKKSLVLDLSTLGDHEVYELRQQITQRRPDVDCFHLIRGDAWLTDDRMYAFNLAREYLAQKTGGSYIFWLSPASITRFALAAPDFWAWRSGVFEFAEVSGPPH